MKWIFFTLSLISTVAIASEDIAKPSSLSIRAKETASRAKETYRWRDADGSHNKTTERSKVVEVEITNFGGKPAPGAKVVIYWISGSGSRLKIIGRGEEELHLNEIKKTVFFESPDFKQKSVKYYYYDTGWTEGEKLTGHVVTLDYQGYDYPVATSAGASAIRSRSDLDKLIDKQQGSRNSNGRTYREISPY